MRDDYHREQNGKKDKHRADSRARKCIRDKLRRRQKALESVQWSEVEKKDMEVVLKKEYMSPEKSSDNNAGSRYRIPFIWESSSLTRRKDELDHLYRASLSERSRKMLFIVEDHPVEQTTTPPPMGTPAWAISRRY